MGWKSRGFCASAVSPINPNNVMQNPLVWRSRQNSKNNGLGMYHHSVEPVTAFVLAGGKSSRMGQDKSFLQLGGCTLLARAVELATAAAGGVYIVGSSEKFAAFGSVIADVYPE